MISVRILSASYWLVNNYDIIDLGVMVSCDKILEAAIKHDVEIIGLSGLITPSPRRNGLCRERNEATRFLRSRFLIGGATTSEKTYCNQDRPRIMTTA